MSEQRRPTIDDIQQTVADYYRIPRAEMVSARQAASVCRPRQIAMFLSRFLTTTTFSQIGRKFGDRDHTTVMHAVSVIMSLKGADAKVAADLARLDHLLTREIDDRQLELSLVEAA